MSTPSTPPRKRPVDATAPNQTPSKKAKTPAKTSSNMASKQPKDGDQSEPFPKITSRVIPRHNLAAEQEALPAQQQEVYDQLRQYLDSVIERGKTARPAEKRRNDGLKIDIIAAMALLYAPWDEEEWAFYYQRTDRDIFPLWFVDTFGNATQNMVNAWLTKPPVLERRSEETRSTTATNAQARVRKWYGDRCIVTGSDSSAACHIIANSIERNSKSTFWDCIGRFWTKDHVTNLKVLMKTSEYQERNLLILDHGLHMRWSRPDFTFKPLPDPDPSKLRLEFHWLSSGTQGPIEHVRGQGSAFADCRHDPPHRLETGDQILLESVDPQIYKLPDPFLVNLGYHVNMVCRASAAGGLLKLLFQEDPDTEGSAVPVEGDMDQADYEYESYGVVPGFNEFLISSAVEQGIISSSRAQKWRKYLNGDDLDDSSGRRDNGERVLD